MINKKILILAILTILTINSIVVVSAVRPNYVYDYAGVFTSEEKATLNSMCKIIDQNTTCEVVVVIMSDIGEYGGDENTAAYEIFNNVPLDGVKGIGDPEENNGVLILVSVSERRWKIETGYGVEGNLTDSECGRIGRDLMVPELSELNWYNGVVAGVQGVANELDGTGNGFEEEEGIDLVTAIIIIIIIIAFVALLAWIDVDGGYSGSGGGWSSGGGGGGFGGGSSGGGGAGGGFICKPNAKRMMLSASALVLILAFSFSSTIIVYADRPNYVYDNANILTDADEARINALVREFDINTTIEIVAYTMQNLGDYGNIDDARYEIFNNVPLDGKTGIGKAGDDNGILLVISVDERDYGVEIGYGLEGNLTDVEGKRVAEKLMIPYLKNDDWGNGIYAFFEGLINEITWEGAGSPLDPEPIEIDPMALITILAIPAVIFILYLTYKLIITLLDWNANRVAKNNRRKRLKTQFAKYSDTTKLETDLAEGWRKVKEYPDWAKQEIDEISTNLVEELANYKSLLGAIGRTFKRDDLDSVENGMETLMDTKEKIYSLLYDMTDKKIAEIEEYKIENPKLEEAISNNIVTTEKFITGQEAKGYNHQEDRDKLFAVEQKLKNLLKNPVNLKLMSVALTSLLGDVNNIYNEVKYQEQVKTSNDTDIELVKKSLERTEKGYPHARKVLLTLGKKHPENVTAETKEKLSEVPAKLKLTKTLLQEVEELNSMDKQHFEEASVKLINVKSCSDEVAWNVENVYDLKEKLHRTKNQIPSQLSSAEYTVQRALNKVQESDVEYEAKRLARRAEGELIKANRIYKNYTGVEILDWIALAGMVALSISLAQRAISLAENDIDEAERKRRKRREDEERRRRMRYENSYSYSSSRSRSSGGYSSGGGGFSSGGFGGGRSGGGGFSGKF